MTSASKCIDTSVVYINVPKMNKFLWILSPAGRDICVPVAYCMQVLRFAANIMRKTIYGLKSNMKNQFFLLCCSFAAFIVLESGVPIAWGEEIADLSTWEDLSHTDLISINGVSQKFQTIFANARASNAKIVSTLTADLQNVVDSHSASDKVHESLLEITKILQYIGTSVSHYYYRIGQFYIGRLNICMKIARLIRFRQYQEIANAYNTDVNTEDEFVRISKELLDSAYSPASILEDTVHDLTENNSYSKDVVETDMQKLSQIVTSEIDKREEYAIKILNQMFKGLEIVTQIRISLRRRSYPDQWAENYITSNLQTCTSLAKILISSCTSVTVSDEQNDTNEKDDDTQGDDIKDKSKDTNTEDASTLSGISTETNVESDLPSNNLNSSTNCDMTFKITERNIIKQLVITIKDIKAIQDVKVINARVRKVFGNFKVILMDLNQKLITDIISFLTQFMQLYNIILIILDKINPKMKIKVSDVYYKSDLDDDSEFIQNIKKYYDQNYIPNEKVTTLYQQIKGKHKSSEDLSQFKEAIVNELSVATNNIGVELKTMEDVTINIFLEIRNGVEALKNLKNRSDNRGLLYYVNFYTGKSDIAMLRRVLAILNVLNMDQLLKTQISDAQSFIANFKQITQVVKSKIVEENDYILSKLDNSKEVTDVSNIVAESVSEYNTVLKTYSTEARKKLTKIITKYVTISEEIIIIIKRKKNKYSNILEHILNDDSIVLDTKSETISKYLSESSEIDIRTDCSSLMNQSDIKETKETATNELRELNTVMNSEVDKIDTTVLDIMNKIISGTQLLNSIKEQASNNEDYELSKEQISSITGVVQLINTLGMKNNVGGADGLDTYLEKIKARVDSAKESFISKTAQCLDKSQLDDQVGVVNKDIHDILSKASVELVKKIKEYTIQYNNKFNILVSSSEGVQLQSSLSANSITSFEISYTFQKYLTNYYSTQTTFINLNSESQDITQLKTDTTAQLQNSTLAINSEIKTIQSEINTVMSKITDGLNTIEDINLNHSKGKIDQSKITTITDTKNIIDVLNKYLNADLKSTEDIDVLFNTARNKINEETNQVCSSIKSSTDQNAVRSLVEEGIGNYEKTYTDLKTSVSKKVNDYMKQFISDYQQTISDVQQKDEKSSNMLQAILNGQNAYQQQNDVEYKKFCEFLSTDYTSLSVRSLYDKQQVQTDTNTVEDTETTIQKVTSLSKDLNQHIDTFDSSRKYVLSSIQEGNKVLQVINKSITSTQNSQYELKDTEINLLQKLIAIKQKFEYSANGNDNIDESISNAQNEIIQESSKAIEKIKTLSVDSDIQQVETSTVSTINSISSKVHQQVYSKLNEANSQFTNSFEQTLSSMQQYEDISKILSDIKNEKTTFNSNDDVKYNKFCSYVSSYDTSSVHTENTEIEDSSLVISQRYINKINTLKDKTTNIVKNIGEIGKYTIANSQTGIQILTQIENSIKQDSNYKLTDEQITQLKKCTTVVNMSQNINTSNEFSGTSINSVVTNAKGEINNVCSETTKLLSSSSHETNFNEEVTNTVSKVQEIYNQVKSNIRTQIEKASSDFTSSSKTILSNTKIDTSSQIATVLQGITNSKTTFDKSSDDQLASFQQYLSDSNFLSTTTVEEWYEKNKGSVIADTSITADQAITSVNNLQDETNKLIDKSGEIGSYVMKNMQASSEIIKRISSSSTYQLTEEEITQLQKMISIVRITQSNCNEISTSFTKSESMINSVINDKRNQINNICDEIIKSIQSTDDETKIDEIVSSSIQNIQIAYGEAQKNVQKEIQNFVTNYSNNMQQTISAIKETQAETSTTLQDITNGYNVYQSDADTEFSSFSSYINSNSYQSSSLTIQRWYRNIKQSTVADSTSIKQCTINSITSLKEKINKEMGITRAEGKYILNNVMQGSKILRDITAKENVQEYVTEDVLTQLKKTSSISQIIQSTNSESALAYVNLKDSVSSAIINAQITIDTECKKATGQINSINEDNKINNIVLDNVDNMEAAYREVFSNLQNTVSSSSQQFSTSLQQTISKMQQEGNTEISSILQDVETGSYINQLTDEKFIKFKAYVNSLNFQSSVVVHNWYSGTKTQTTTELTNIKEDSLQSINTLKSKVEAEFAVASGIGNYVLDNLREGSTIINYINSIKKDTTNAHLTQTQITQLQTTFAITHIMQSIAEGTSASIYENSENSITTVVTNAQGEIDNTCVSVKNSLDSVTDQNILHQTISNNANQIGNICFKSKTKIQNEMTELTQKFAKSFQKSVTDMQLRDTELSAVLTNIINGKDSYTEDDKKLEEFRIYMKKVNYDSYIMVRNWYSNVQTITKSTDITEEKQQITSYINNLQQDANNNMSALKNMGSYAANTLLEGSKLVQQIHDSYIQSTSFQLTEEQKVLLQKCIIIVQTTQCISTIKETTLITTNEQSLLYNINNAKTEISNSCDNAISSIKGLNDKSVIDKAVSRNVDKIQSSYNQIRDSVQTQVIQSSNNFISNFWQSMNDVQKYENSEINTVFQNVLNEENYSNENDQDIQKLQGYLSDMNFNSVNGVHNWYSNIQVDSTSVTNVNEVVTHNIYDLQSKINDDISNMQSVKDFVTNDLQKSSQLIQQIKESLQTNSVIQVTKEQKMLLQRSMTIIEMLQSTFIQSSTSAKYDNTLITRDIKKAISAVKDSCRKATEAIQMAKDDESINKSVSNGINEFETAYNNVKVTTKSQIKQSTSSFLSTYQQTISQLQENTNVREFLQSISDKKDLRQYVNDKEFNTFESYVQNSNFQSLTVVQNLYADMKKSVNINDETNISSSSTDMLNNLKGNVNREITKVDFVGKYVTENMEKGLTLINEINTNIKQNSAYELSEVQKTELQKYILITQTIQKVCTESSESKSAITSNITAAQSEITDICSRITTLIGSLNAKDEINQITVLKSVKDIDAVYTGTRDDMKSQMEKSSNSFLTKIGQITESKQYTGNTVLNDIINRKISYQDVNDEEFQKFQTYISNVDFKSTSLVQFWYSDIQKNVDSTQVNVNQQTINTIQKLKDVTDNNMNNMQFLNKYITQNIDKGSQILDQFVSSNSVELSETQITQLKRSITIVQTLQKVFSTNIESTSVSSSNVVNVQNQINNACSNLITSVESLNNKDAINKVVSEKVNGMETSYTNFREQVKSKVSHSSTDFYTTLGNTVTQLKQMQSGQVGTVLDNILQGKSTYQEDAEFTNFRTFITSSNFLSTSVINNWKQRIHESVNTGDVDTKKIGNIISNMKDDVDKSMTNINTMDKYSDDTFQKGAMILQEINNSISTNSKVELTSKQTTILQKCFTMYNVVKNISFNSNNISAQKIDMSTIASTVNSSVSTSQNKISDDYNKAIQSISSSTDQTEIKQTTTNCIDKFEKTYNNVKEETYNGMKQISSAYSDNYPRSIASITEKNPNLGNTLNDIVTGRNAYQVEGDKDYENFVAFVKSSNFQSSTTVQELYTKITIQESKANTNELAVNQLHNLNEEVNSNINSMNQHANYFISNLQKGYEIMETIKKSVDQNTEYSLTQDQIIQLQKCTVLISIVKEITTVTSTTITTKTQSLVSEGAHPNSVNIPDGQNNTSVKPIPSSPTDNHPDEIAIPQSYATNTRDIPSTSKLITPSSDDSLSKTNSIPAQTTTLPITKSNDSKSTPPGNTNAPISSDGSKIPYKPNLNIPVTNNLNTDSNKLNIPFNKGQFSDKPQSNLPVTNSLNTNDNQSNIPFNKGQFSDSFKTSTTSTQQQSAHSSSSSSKHQSTTVNSQFGSASSNMSNMEQQSSYDSNVQYVVNVEKNTKKHVYVIEDSGDNSDDADTSVYKIQKVNEKTVISEADSSHNTVQNTQTLLNKNEKLDDNKTIQGLLVPWDVTESTSKIWPSTCESLTWNKGTYVINKPDEDRIKEIADLLKVGRKVIFDSINVAKENLQLYIKVDDFQSVLISCTEKIDTVLQQLSAAVASNMQSWTIPFIGSVNQLRNAAKTLNAKALTMDDQYVSSAKTFFGLQYRVRSELLKQINDQLGQDVGDTVDEADVIAVKKLQQLENMMKIILNNADCLVLRSVNVVMNGKSSLEYLQTLSSSGDVAKVEKSYQFVKNAQIVSDIINNIKHR